MLVVALASWSIGVSDGGRSGLLVRIMRHSGGGSGCRRGGGGGSLLRGRWCLWAATGGWLVSHVEAGVGCSNLPVVVGPGLRSRHVTRRGSLAVSVRIGQRLVLVAHFAEVEVKL